MSPIVQHRLQYLESMDSVRMTPPGRANTSGDANGDRDGQIEKMKELQSFFDVLITLVLGRAVVVPQSYAFDSWAFLSVAERVLKARDKAGSADLPFRLHVFGNGIKTFGEAVWSMLERVHDPDRPFVSSLLPALAEMHPDRLAELRSEGLPSLRGWARNQLAEDQLPAGLAAWGEFEHQTPVGTTPRAGVTLERMLGDLVNPASAMSRMAEAMEQESREVHARLVESVQLLDPKKPASFAQRSRLRQEVAWPGDPDGQSAREIVGIEQLPLVIEFVDTWYNQVVADSIGVAPAAFSTPVSLSQARQDARRVAQELVLETSRTRKAPVQVGDDPPGFEMWLNPQVLRSDDKVRAEVERLMTDASSLLNPLMDARGDKRSPFWKGVEKLEEAISAGEQNKVDDALKSHVDHVASVLGHGVLTLGGSGHVQLTLTTAVSAGVGCFVASNWKMPVFAATVLAATGAAAPNLYNQATAKMKQNKEAKRTATAFIKYMQLSPGGAS